MTLNCIIPSHDLHNHKPNNYYIYQLLVTLIMYNLEHKCNLSV